MAAWAYWAIMWPESTPGSSARNAFRPRPDLVVISGDLADTPTADEYEHLKGLLSQLDLRFVSIPGVC